MIKILVVEDEPPIARGIVKLIEGYDCEQELSVQSAINGKRALDLLNLESFDIVFSDIKMPVMDGLELAKVISEQFPNILTIMVSGFQDFDYARKAIRYKVFDYMLKPVRAEDMYNQLDKLLTTFTSRSVMQSRTKVLKAIQNSDPAVIDENQLYAVFLVCVGAFPLTPDETLLPAIGFFNQINLEHMVDELTDKQEVSMCFNGKSSAEKIVVISVNDQKRIELIADALMSKLEKISHMPITVAANNELVELNTIYNMFIRLRTCIHNSLIMFQSHSFLLGETEYENSDNYQHECAENSDSYSDLLIALKTNNKNKILDSVGYAIMELVDRNATQLEFVFFFERILTTFFAGKMNDKQIMQTKTDIRTAFSNAVTQEDLSCNLCEIFDYSLPDKQADEKSTSHQQLCENIESYLKNNYNKNITNTLLSQEFGFVSSYISKIFREHKGISPSEYLTRFRIDTAKIILTNQPNTLVKEVARTVGFNDQHYFSKIFKRETGLWPTEFQSQ